MREELLVGKGYTTNHNSHTWLHPLNLRGPKFCWGLYVPLALLSASVTDIFPRTCAPKTTKKKQGEKKETV